MEGFKDGGSEIGVARVGTHSHLEEEGGYVATASTPPKREGMWKQHPPHPTLVKGNYPQKKIDVASMWAANGTSRAEGRGDTPIFFGDSSLPIEGQKARRSKAQARPLGCDLTPSLPLSLLTTARQTAEAAALTSLPTC